MHGNRDIGQWYWRHLGMGVAILERESTMRFALRARVGCSASQCFGALRPKGRRGCRKKGEPRDRPQTWVRGFRYAAGRGRLRATRRVAEKLTTKTLWTNIDLE